MTPVAVIPLSSIMTSLLGLFLFCIFLPISRLLLLLFYFLVVRPRRTSSIKSVYKKMSAAVWVSSYLFGHLRAQQQQQQQRFIHYSRRRILFI